MKIIGTSVPVLTTDIESAIARYASLTRESVRARFEIPDRGLSIALIGSLTVVAGTEDALAPLRSVRATFTVDSIEEYEAYLRSSGSTILQCPSATPMGKNMIARDASGAVFEFVEPSS